MGKERDDEILRIVKEIRRDVRQILKFVEPAILTKGQVLIMPKTIAVGGTATATLALLDQTGAAMTIDSTYTVAYSASNPSNVTFGTPNADGSNTVVGVNPDPGDLIGAVDVRRDERGGPWPIHRALPSRLGPGRRRSPPSQSRPGSGPDRPSRR